MELIPDCLHATQGPFNRDAVEAFFAARRDAIMDKKAEPLTPIDAYPHPIPARWRQYLWEKAARQRPMNGLAQSSGKLAPSRYVRAATLVEEIKGAPADDILKAGIARFEAQQRTNVDVTVDKSQPVMATVVTTGRPKGDQPWLALGITRQAWYKRRAKLTEDDLRKAIESD